MRSVSHHPAKKVSKSKRATRIIIQFEHTYVLSIYEWAIWIRKERSGSEKFNCHAMPNETAEVRADDARLINIHKYTKGMCLSKGLRACYKLNYNSYMNTPMYSIYECRVLIICKSELSFSVAKKKPENVGKIYFIVHV